MWRTSLWRSQIDQVLAHQILAGDRRCLTQRLQTFAAVPQGLASLLQQLQNAVTDAERAIELHAVWPLILDALLPNVRTRDDDAYHGDIEELDQALLADRVARARPRHRARHRSATRHPRCAAPNTHFQENRMTDIGTDRRVNDVWSRQMSHEVLDADT